jgi:RND family efflux transporter MFP subunit
VHWNQTVRVLALSAAVLTAGLFSQAAARAQVEAVTTARHDLELGFVVGGRVDKVQVKPGDLVKQGDVLIELEDKEGVAVIERLKFRLSNDSEIRAAIAKHKLAVLQEERLKELVAKQAAAPFELKSAEVQAEIAAIEVEIAKQNMEDLQKQLDQAQARHEQYVLKAPSAGAIEVVKLETGELVEELKPVLRLVMTEVLWVDAAVPTAQTLTLKTDAPAWVRSKLAGFDEAVQGKIVFVAEVADAASDTRMVRVEVPNTQRLPAGGLVSVSFSPPGTKVSQASH